MIVYAVIFVSLLGLFAIAGKKMVDSGELKEDLPTTVGAVIIASLLSTVAFGCVLETLIYLAGLINAG